MIDHTGINVTDLDRSKRFYAAVLASLGYSVRLELPGAVGFGDGDPALGADPGGDFWIAAGEPFVPRSHIAFRARDAAQVSAFYAAALAAGGRDTTARPGPARTTTPATTPPSYSTQMVTTSKPSAMQNKVSSMA